MKHEMDFYAWTQFQAEALRAGTARAEDIDWRRVADEIEGLGRSRRTELRYLLIRTVEHLLKLEYSPAQGPRRVWRDGAAAHRAQAKRLLSDNPSLGQIVDFDDVYVHARELAVASLAIDGVASAALPRQSPYSQSQVLDGDWWPISRAA